MFGFSHCSAAHGSRHRFRPRWLGHFRRRRLGRALVRDLHLNEEQQRSLQAALDTIQDTRQGVFTDLSGRLVNFRELLSAPAIDRPDMRDLLRTAQDCAFERVSRAAEQIADFVDSLSPEQRAKMAQWLERKWACESDPPLH